MFDFLRHLKDDVMADLSIAIHGFNYSADDNRVPSSVEVEFNENDEYLSAVGGGLNTYTYAYIMTEIRNKNLIGTPIDKISSIIYRSVEDIRNALQVYSVMNFLKSKSYSANEAKEIMRVANIFDKDRTKDVKEIAKLADCSEDAVNAVIKLLNELNEFQKMTRQQQMLYAITKHKDFGKKNPVDIGIECGYSEKEVIELIRSLEQETKENE